MLYLLINPPKNFELAYYHEILDANLPKSERILIYRIHIGGYVEKWIPSEEIWQPVIVTGYEPRESDLDFPKTSSNT